MDDSCQAGVGTFLDDLGKFRMPTGKKSIEWLDRADAARKHVSHI